MRKQRTRKALHMTKGGVFLQHVTHEVDHGAVAAVPGMAELVEWLSRLWDLWRRCLRMPN